MNISPEDRKWFYAHRLNEQRRQNDQNTLKTLIQVTNKRVLKGFVVNRNARFNLGKSRKNGILSFSQREI